MFILETLNFVVDILKVPSVLVGLIALIGLVAQKKSFSDVVKGTIKTILGFIVLGGGATVLVGSLNPLGGMFEHAFNIQGIIPNNEAIVSIALEKYGASTALIMAFGMVANIVVARFTRLKYIFLTGHHTFYMACMIGVILTVAGFEGIGLVFTGSLMGIQPHSVSLAYGVTKSAVHALVKNMVKFLVPYELRVNAVAPGFVDTEWQKTKPAEIRRNIENKVSLGRFCDPEELAEVYKMLIENSYFNGEVVVVDGGYSYK